MDFQIGAEDHNGLAYTFYSKSSRVQPTERNFKHHDLSTGSNVSRDSPVGTATRYGLDGPEIESRWGVRFSALVQTGPRAHPASCTMGTGSLSRGVKRPGRGVDHPPHLAPRLKKE